MAAQAHPGAAIRPVYELGVRTVVVSPHLDDAVLSLGAAIARAGRSGARVEVLTVLGCDPASAAPAGGWDSRAGFSTEGEAARARREEDRRACAILGARPVWLPFGNADYDRHGDEGDVQEAVADATAGADIVLVPGFPLTHSDHAWLTEALVWSGMPWPRLGLYVEQPYALYVRSERPRPEVPGWLQALLRTPADFTPAPVGARDVWSKLKALRQYRSQLALLGMTGRTGAGLYGTMWSEMRAGSEAIAWVG